MTLKRIIVKSFHKISLQTMLHKILYNFIRSCKIFSGIWQCVATDCHGNTHVISTQTLKYNYNITLFLAVRLAPLVTRAFAASSLLFNAARCSGV